MPVNHAASKRYRADRRAIARRVHSLMHKDESQARFARRCHVNQQNLSRFFGDHVGIGLDQLVRISRTTGRSLDWLVNGR